MLKDFHARVERYELALRHLDQELSALTSPPAPSPSSSEGKLLVRMCDTHEALVHGGAGARALNSLI